MITAQGDLLLIPFGTASFHPEKLELAGFSPDGLRLSSASPCVLIDRALRAPLRLSSAPLPVATPGIGEVARDVEGELRLLQHHLERLCGEWTRPPRRFLQRYFEEVRLEIARNEEVLAERAAPFAGLYEAAHWTFSALLPLPRAHLHLPDAGARASLLPPTSCGSISRSGPAPGSSWSRAGEARPPRHSGGAARASAHGASRSATTTRTALQVPPMAGCSRTLARGSRASGGASACRGGPRRGISLARPVAALP